MNEQVFGTLYSIYRFLAGFLNRQLSTLTILAFVTRYSPMQPFHISTIMRVLPGLWQRSARPFFLV